MAVRWTTKEISQLSNVCYNRGLEKAQVRDMEGAILELKRCLQLNKNHIDARNLLGLVYYEIGEMADALAEMWVTDLPSAPEDSQMAREIAWFLHENPLRPKVMIACDRLAWQAKDDPELRITFDESIRWREDRLRMDQGGDGEELLPQGHVLMEIKLPEAAPLWLAHLLSELEVYPTSFSKYGTCYKNYLLWEYLEGESVYV
jgi:tetratricopeptide (TPR) repeat protein